MSRVIHMVLCNGESLCGIDGYYSLLVKQATCKRCIKIFRTRGGKKS